MILYRKIIKYQDGGYIYKSVEDAQNDHRLSGIQTKRGKSTLCLGSALNAGSACGYDWRPTLAKYYNEHGFRPRLKGEKDNIIDSWNMYDVLRDDNEDVTFIYNAHEGQELDDETLRNLPLYSVIGTGDARGVYVPGDNERRSRHTMMVIGYLEDGTPLIYDLGKIRKGLPAKYRNQVNYIAAPTKNIIYFEGNKQEDKVEKEQQVEELTETPKQEESESKSSVNTQTKTTESKSNDSEDASVKEGETQEYVYSRIAPRVDIMELLRFFSK